MEFLQCVAVRSPVESKQRALVDAPLVGAEPKDLESSCPVAHSWLQHP